MLTVGGETGKHGEIKRSLHRDFRSVCVFRTLESRPGFDAGVLIQVAVSGTGAVWSARSAFESRRVKRWKWSDLIFSSDLQLNPLFQSVSLLHPPLILLSFIYLFFKFFFFFNFNLLYWRDVTWHDVGAASIQRAEGKEAECATESICVFVVFVLIFWSFAVKFCVKSVFCTDIFKLIKLFWSADV